MILLVLAYLAAIVGANLSVATFGPGSVIINAFILVALDLAARDRLHTAWKGRGLPWKMACLIGAGGLLSYLLNSGAGQIALASFVAFSLAAIADTAVFMLLEKTPWLVKSNGSNFVSATVDSLVFTWLAFGSIMPVVIVGQVAAKTIGGLIWSNLLKPGSKPKVAPALVGCLLVVVLVAPELNQAFIYFD